MPTTRLRCIECDTPLLGSTAGVGKDRQPCPQCGSVGRKIIVVHTETVGVSDSVSEKILTPPRPFTLEVTPLDGLFLSSIRGPDGMLEPMAVGTSEIEVFRAALPEFRRRLDD